MKHFTEFTKLIEDSELWEKQKISSLQNNKWCKNEWWHHKYYDLSEDNDGNKIQELKIGDKIIGEIPYQRNLFNPSTGRFNLGKKPIAYFSNDFSTACCETIDEFRLNDKLTFENNLRPYFEGKVYKHY